MNRKVIIILPVLILLSFSVLFCILSYQEIKKISSFFSDDEISAVYPLILEQKSINRHLEVIAKSKEYTIDKAYVELNPYKISPLSAIIIFRTDSNTEVEVSINGQYVTKMTPSMTHIIPIAGLYEDYYNLITLKANDQTYEYYIKTEKSNINYPLEVKAKSSSLNAEELYFTVASYETWLTAWDIEGNLRFYLTKDFRMDIEFLDNGHFLIGTTQGENREQFIGFYEMDYLGKIYNYYTLEHGYSFEFQKLKDGNLMLAGGDQPIYMDEQYVYVIDPHNGRTISELNLSDVIADIDEDFPREYLGANVIRNGFYYREDTHELLVSFRSINTILCFDYEAKSLKWIFTDPNNPLFKNSCWDAYKVTSDYRYPLGQHTPTFTSEGYVAFFNNGYDRLALSQGIASDNIADYNGAYSSLEIYDIKDNKAHKVWTYDEDKKILSIKYGLLNVLDNNHKLVNYGYIIKDAYRHKSGNSISATENNPDNIYARILELDDKDKIVFEAICEEGKYRVFKHQIYNDVTDNISLTLNMYNTIPDSKYSVDNYKDYDLNNASEWINTLEFTKNTFKSNYEINDTDEVSFLFLNSRGKVFNYTYKEKENSKTNRVFNLELPKGEYEFYISINGNIYDTKKVVTYD